MMAALEVGVGRIGKIVGFCIAALALLSGCSFVSGLFPDKQKEYRYSSELPPLEIPPDLIASASDGSDSASSSESGDRSETESATAESRERESRSEPAAASSRSGNSAPAATLAQGADDVPLIEVESPFAETWNDVSRALGRMEVEISDQNRSDGVFYVYYGGDTKKYEDRGLWQDITSLFSDGGPKAQEFRLKLEGKDSVTNIFVMDKDGQAVKEGVGLDLMKRLQDKLQTLDQPDKQNDQTEPKEEQ